MISSLSSEIFLYFQENISFFILIFNRINVFIINISCQKWKKNNYFERNQMKMFQNKGSIKKKIEN